MSAWQEEYERSQKAHMKRFNENLRGFDITSESNIEDFAKALPSLKIGRYKTQLGRIAVILNNKQNEFIQAGLKTIGDFVNKPEVALKVLGEFISDRSISFGEFATVLENLNGPLKTIDKEKNFDELEKSLEESLRETKLSMARSWVTVEGKISPETSVEQFCQTLLTVSAKGYEPSAQKTGGFDALLKGLRKLDCRDTKDILNLPIGKAMSIEAPAECKEAFVNAVGAIDQAFKSQRRKIYRNK